MIDNRFEASAAANFPRLALVLLALVLALLSFVTLAAEPASPIVLMWQVGSEVPDADLQSMHQSGVTAIQDFNLTDWKDPIIASYLANARSAHLGVIIYLGNLLDRDEKAGSWAFGERANAFVQKWMSDPAILAWHTFDEPKEPRKRALARYQQAVYAALKAVDPNHPILVSNNAVSDSEFRDYFSESAFDWLELHAYMDGSIGQRQENLLTAFKTRHRRTYPVIVTLRAFNGKGWSNLNQNDIQAQYLFFRKYPFVTGIGFYGWTLGPSNKGISADTDLRARVLDVAKEFKTAQ